MKNNQFVSVPKSYILKLKELGFIDNDNLITEKFINYYKNYLKGEKDNNINYYSFICRLIELIQKSIATGLIEKINNVQFKTYGIIQNYSK